MSISPERLLSITTKTVEGLKPSAVSNKLINQLSACHELCSEKPPLNPIGFAPVEVVRFDKARLYLSDVCWPLPENSTQRNHLVTHRMFDLYKNGYCSSGFIGYNSILGGSNYARYHARIKGISIPNEIICSVLREYDYADYCANLHEVADEINNSFKCWVQIEGHHNVVIGAKVDRGTIIVEVCTTRQDTYTCKYEELIKLSYGDRYNSYYRRYDRTVYQTVSVGHYTSASFKNHRSRSRWIEKQRDNFLGD